MTTLKLCVSSLADASLPTQVTGVVPWGNVEPEGGLQLTVGPPQVLQPLPGQLSATDTWGEYTTTASQRPGSVPWTWSVGVVTTGGCLSCTVTVKVVFAVSVTSPQLADWVTEQSIIEVPTGKSPVRSYVLSGPPP